MLYPITYLCKKFQSDAILPHEVEYRARSEHTLFPNLMKLVNAMFLIPVQTAVVERGFSLHR